MLELQERFLEVVRFGSPDKIPLSLWEIRPATLTRWWREGLPHNMQASRYFRFDIFGLASRNLTSYPQEGFKWEPSDKAVNIGPIPPFRYRILRRSGRYRVWIDSLGITQIGFEADWKSGWSGFATRSFLEFPVRNRKDFKKIAIRYDPNTPNRYPRKWSELLKELRKRNGKYLTNMSIRGPFWWLRDMMGLEATLKNLFRERNLVEDTLQLYLDFHIAVLKKLLDDVDVDWVTLGEDMAYNSGPMFSPSIFRDYLSPIYNEFIQFLKQNGARTTFVDSDGNLTLLIPELMKSGIDGISPCEAASGMDVVEIRNRFPNLVLMNGLDKRKLCCSKKEIRKYLSMKVPFLLRTGGYFPGVDHAVPPNVSFENFAYLLSLLKRMCGWNRHES